MKSNKSRTGKSIIYVSAFCLTAGIVHHMQSSNLEISKQHYLMLRPDPRGADCIRTELAERGWTREQLDASDRKYQEHLSHKGLAGGGY